jgi:hypothetical protein
MHLVCFWPSPTFRARQKRQRGASGVRWWVGTARFCVQDGCFFPCKMTPFPPHLLDTAPVSAQANQCTSFASGFRPHPLRGGITNGGHLERGGGSERSVVSVRRRGPRFLPHSTPPRLCTGDLCAIRTNSGTSRVDSAFSIRHHRTRAKARSELGALIRLCGDGARC